MLIFAFVLALMLKEVPLRRVSGMQAARAEAEAGTPDAGGATHELIEPDAGVAPERST